MEEMTVVKSQSSEQTDNIERCDDVEVVNNSKKFDNNIQKNGGKNRKFIFIGLAVLAIVIIVVCCANQFSKGVQAAKDSFNSSMETRANEVRDKVVAAAAAEVHTSNDVAIVIGNLKDEAALEVLEVYNVAYIIEDAEDNESDIISWLEVPGKGVFTVDLKVSEFVVDNERNYVLARVPRPELTDCTIIYEKVNRLLFKNDAFNDSIGVGENLARQQLEDGYQRIKKSFVSNTKFYQSAQVSAENIIVNLIKSLNSEVKDLVVEVEFIN